MIDCFLEVLETNGRIRKEYELHANTDWSNADPQKRAEIALDLLNKIEDNKGEFAQKLAESLSNENVNFEIPKYIEDAIYWVCEMKHA